MTGPGTNAQQHGQPQGEAGTQLQALPEHVLSHITTKCSLEARQNLRLTCRLLQRVADEGVGSIGTTFHFSSSKLRPIGSSGSLSSMPSSRLQAHMMLRSKSSAAVGADSCAGGRGKRAGSVSGFPRARRLELRCNSHCGLGLSEESDSPLLSLMARLPNLTALDAGRACMSALGLQRLLLQQGLLQLRSLEISAQCLARPEDTHVPSLAPIAALLPGLSEFKLWGWTAQHSLAPLASLLHLTALQLSAHQDFACSQSDIQPLSTLRALASLELMGVDLCEQCEGSEAEGTRCAQGSAAGAAGPAAMPLSGAAAAGQGYAGTVPQVHSVTLAAAGTPSAASAEPSWWEAGGHAMGGSESSSSRPSPLPGATRAATGMQAGWGPLPACMADDLGAAAPNLQLQHVGPVSYDNAMDCTVSSFICSEGETSALMQAEASISCAHLETSAAAGPERWSTNSLDQLVHRLALNTNDSEGSASMPAPAVAAGACQGAGGAGSPAGCVAQEQPGQQQELTGGTQHNQCQSQQQQAEQPKPQPWKQQLPRGNTMRAELLAAMGLSSSSMGGGAAGAMEYGGYGGLGAPSPGYPQTLGMFGLPSEVSTYYSSNGSGLFSHDPAPPEPSTGHPQALAPSAAPALAQPAGQAAAAAAPSLPPLPPPFLLQQSQATSGVDLGCLSALSCLTRLRLCGDSGHGQGGLRRLGACLHGLKWLEVAELQGEFLLPCTWAGLRQLTYLSMSCLVCDAELALLSQLPGLQSLKCTAFEAVGTAGGGMGVLEAMGITGLHSIDYYGHSSLSSSSLFGSYTSRDTWAATAASTLCPQLTALTSLEVERWRSPLPLAAVAPHSKRCVVSQSCGPELLKAGGPLPAALEELGVPPEGLLQPRALLYRPGSSTYSYVQQQQQQSLQHGAAAQQLPQSPSAAAAAAAGLLPLLPSLRSLELAGGPPGGGDMLAAAYAGTAASTVNAALQGWARAGGLSQLTVCPLEDRAAGAQLNDALLATFGASFPQLTRLKLMHADRVSDAGLAALAQPGPSGAPALQEVVLGGLPRVTKQGVAALAARPCMRRVLVAGCARVTESECRAVEAEACRPWLSVEWLPHAWCL